MQNNELSRRLFLAHMTALSAGCMLAARDDHQNPSQRIDIAQLTLGTAQPIAVMKAFYASRLGMPVVQEDNTSLTLRAGHSMLTFQHDPTANAFYHFAFNIPSNQISSAHAWLKARECPLIVPPRRLNDDEHARDIVAFRHWNAHSVFFWDPAGSAVEFIARHDLKNEATQPFSSDAVLNISEIGLVVDDVPSVAEHIRKSLGATSYIGANAAFDPIGDQHGLILMMTRGQSMAFGQGRKRDAYPTTIELQREMRTDVRCEGFPYVIRPSNRRRDQPK
ncbi:MAG: hypothetical protein AAF432_01415 [Planctomycetota bacterium]